MNLSFWYRIGFVIWTTAACVGSVVKLDSKRLYSASVNRGTTLSKQILTSVQNLSQAATNAGMNDPATWAIQYLALAPEPRFYTLKALYDSPKRELPYFELDQKNQFTYYDKLSDLKTPTWVEITLKAEPLHFMGLSNKFYADLALLGFTLLVAFCFYQISLYGISSQRDPQKQDLAPQNAPTEPIYKTAPSVPSQSFTDADLNQLKLAAQNQYDLEISAVALALEAYRNKGNTSPELQKAKSLFESARKTRLSLIHLAKQI